MVEAKDYFGPPKITPTSYKDPEYYKKLQQWRKDHKDITKENNDFEG